jgi:asparagine synthase (glutamine-hydrolysing)
LDNRRELIHQLEATQKVSDDELVALAWLKWGDHCPEKLIGDFAFAVASPRTGVVFLARDVMGVKPLYYRLDEHGLFFATSAAAFKALKIGTLTPSKRWMVEFLIDMSCSHTETAYEEIKKLPAAHSLLIDSDGRSSLRRYHRFIDDAPHERKRDNHWLEAYRAAWQEAIACRMPEHGLIACENSGGLDSGSITAEVARQLGPDIGRLHGLGFSYEQQEPDHIMATAMHWGIKHNSLFSHDTGVQLDLERSIAINGYPQEHVNGLSHYPFYELCQKYGIGCLLSGFGGDEAVTYPGGIPARLELLDQGNWRGLWHSFSGPVPMRLARLAKTFYTSRNMPKQNAGFMASWRARWPHHFLSAEVVAEYGLEADYFASATYDERYRTVNEAVLYLLSRSLLPTRLENCSLMAASYGIDYAWPLLDQRLIQQWLSTPTIWKVGDGGMNRFLHRSAVAGVCPDKVAWKPSKDMGYQGVSSIADVADNRLLYQQALALIENVPDELMKVLDVAKIRIMAEEALKTDRRGQVVRTAWSANVYQLELLSNWLRLQ